MAEKLAIIGSGPAGLTAAVYAGRSFLEPLVFVGPAFGGQIATTTEVDNFPGFPSGLQGPELTTAMREQPWSTPFLLLALGLAFASVFARVQPMVFGETNVLPLEHPPALVPVFVHLGLGLMLGLYIPPYLDTWYRQAAAMLGH